MRSIGNSIITLNSKCTLYYVMIICTINWFAGCSFKLTKAGRAHAHSISVSLVPQFIRYCTQLMVSRLVGLQVH